MEAEWFGLRLRELREAAGLTQSDLAAQAGLTREGIAQLETGRRKPAWESVLTLCKALGVDCTAFTAAPSTQERPGPGRPAKAKAEATEPKRKKLRGRPRKETPEPK